MITPQFSSIKEIKRKIYNLSKPTLISHFDMYPHEPITFLEKDLVLNKKVRVTSIVFDINMTRKGIDKCQVKRGLIDTKATKNISYFKYFKEIRMNDSHLKPSNMVFEGFISNKISVKGTVKVKVTLGSDACTRKEEIKFYVVDIKFPYNAILGTLAHAAFKLVVSMFHQQVRFATKNDIGFVKSNPKSLLGYMMKSHKQ